MPNKHFYFSLGASHGVLMAIVIRYCRHWLAKRFAFIRNLYKWDRDWFLYFPLLIAVFGIMGLIPDILYALNIFPKEFIRSEIFNIFYGYSWFEIQEDVFPYFDWLMNMAGSILLFAISVGTLIFYARYASNLINQKNLHDQK